MIAKKFVQIERNISLSIPSHFAFKFKYLIVLDTGVKTDYFTNEALTKHNEQSLWSKILDF